MDAQFWRERWRENRIGFHSPRPNPLLLEYWRAAGFGTARTVFVPLCGKARDMAWLAAHGHRIVGVELVESALAQFCDEQGLTPQIHREGDFAVYRSGPYRLLAGDFFDLTPQHLGGADAVYDRAARVALPEARRAKYLVHLRQLMPAAARFLISLEFDPPERNGPPFHIAPSEVTGEPGFHARKLGDRDLQRAEPGRWDDLESAREVAWKLMPTPPRQS